MPLSCTSPLATQPSALTTLPSVSVAHPYAIAETNEALIELWLHGRSVNTCNAYKQDIQVFLAFVHHKLLSDITLNDLQAFASHLAQQQYAPATQRRRLTAIKSLLTYGYDLEILNHNVGKRIQLPKVKVTLAERILSEPQVLTLLENIEHPRNHALVRLLYATGGRVSEICNLRWRDLQDSNLGRGQVTLFGKGQKTRTVVFSATTWQIVRALRGDANDNDLVFKSRTGRLLHRTQIVRILRVACARAGIAAQVSPHWLRHSHATHALERGTPITLVQTTLGHANLATTGIYLHVRPQESSALYLSV